MRFGRPTARRSPHTDARVINRRFNWNFGNFEDAVLPTNYFGRNQLVGFGRSAAPFQELTGAASKPTG